MPDKDAHTPVSRVRMPLSDGVWTLGRSAECDIVLDEPAIAEIHAQLMIDQGQLSIVNSGAYSGVYVNGVRVDQSPLHDGDRIFINPVHLRLDDGELLVEGTSTGGYRVDAIDISRSVGSTTLVDAVSFSMLPGELVAIIGPSGCGKTSLMTMLCGATRPDGGAVLYNGEDLYDNLASFRPSIGFVAQFPAVHATLTVGEVIGYEGRLRLSNSSAAERRAAIDRSLETVELSHRFDTRVEHLSGGERKRLSIAVELLAEPRVLWLDEPTSGLDPHLHRTFMALFRDLADTGLTVVVVTHDPDGLEHCDRLAFLVPGGRLAFNGKPADAPRQFAVHDLVECYMVAQETPDHVADRHRRTHSQPATVPRSRRRGTVRSHVDYSGDFTQLRVKTARNIRLLLNDPKTVATLLLQAPLIGLIIALVVTSDVFVSTEVSARRLITASFALSLTMVWMGLINSVREFSKERRVWERDRMTGAAVLPYLASKLLVQSGIVVTQAFILVAVVGLVKGGLPREGIVVSPGWIELVATLSLTGIAAASLGLLVSSVVANEDRGSSFVPYLIIPQFLLCGVVFELPRQVATISMATFTYWSTAALGSTMDACSRGFTGGPTCAAALNAPFDHSVSALTMYWAVLASLAVVFIALTGLTLTFRDRARHL